MSYFNNLLVLQAGGASPQTLTQSASFSNSNTLTYTHTVTPGAVGLTASLFTNDPTFYTHTVTQPGANQTLTATGYDNGNAWYDLQTSSAESWFSQPVPINEQTFYAHTVGASAGSQSLTQSSTYTNDPTFYTHSLSTTVSLTQSSTYSNSNTLNYTHVIDTGVATILGTETITWAAGTNPAAQNISIPSDCTAVYVFWQFWDAECTATLNGVTSMTLASAAADQSVTELDHAGSGTYSSCIGARVWYDPPTGTQSLDVQWELSSGPDEGPACLVVYVKNGDRSSWRTADADSQTGSTAVSYASFATSAGDLILKYDARFSATNTAPSLQSGWTNVVTGANNTQAFRLSTVVASGSTQSMTTQDPDWSGLVAISIPYSGSSGAQNLTQSARFDNNNTLNYSHTLSVGPVTLAQSARHNNAQTYYTHTLTPGPVNLTANLYSNSPTFYTHTLAVGAVTLTQSARFNNSNTFYTHTATPGPVTLTQGTRYSNAQTYYTHTLVTGPVTLTQGTRFDNSPTFYSHTISLGASSLTQSSRYDNANTFYTHSLATGPVTLTANLYSNSPTFYNHTVTTGPVTITQTARFDSSNTYYAHTLVPGPVTLTATARFDNSNSFFTHTLTPGTVTLTAQLYTNSNTFYAHVVAKEGYLEQSARFDNENTFFAHSAGIEQYLVPVRYDNASTFLSHQIYKQYPDPSEVLLGVKYGGPGLEFVGELEQGYDGSLKVDLVTGKMVKVLNNKVVLTF